MARPVAADAERTQQRILAAATGLFSMAGPGDVSIRQVGREAGVSLATVHHYFGSKDQLYGACIEGMYAELQALKEALVPEALAAPTPSALVERAVRTSFRFACAHRGALRLLMRTIIDRGELEPVRRAQVHLPFLAESAAALAARFQRPENEMRLLVQSIMHLVVRWALAAPQELVLLVGRDDVVRGPEAERAIEDHLVAMAAIILGGER